MSTSSNSTAPSASADWLGKTGFDPVKHNGSLDPSAQAQRSQEGMGLSATQDSNATMTQSSSPASAPAFEGHELDAFLGKAFDETPMWKQLYESIHDVFFPRKLPPLELTSTPIPVPDRMAVKTNPWAVGTATVINGAILAIILILGARQVIKAIEKPKLDATNIDVGTFMAPKKANMAGGGGGGGAHDMVDPTKGKLPPRMKDPIVPPMVPILEHPKLAFTPAINVQQDIKLPDNPLMANFGTHTGQNVVLSNGQGSGGGMGTGSGGGIGSGTGNGYGPGYGGNAGGGVYRVGGGISAPVALVTPEAEFSDEARRAKYQGVVLISLIVDAQGNPQNPRVVRPLGMGLDEKAMEAVRKYKFKPALKDGRTPVPVMITVEVNFRLY
ncbi:MAG TPA: energy transducer TonB [Terracidiphilus sp.]|nr:energy transducer TonB [Terracidiphilus sp.]